jgi:hypothetical protein
MPARQRPHTPHPHGSGDGRGLKSGSSGALSPTSKTRCEANRSPVSNRDQVVGAQGELTITATFRHANTYPEALALMADGRVDVAPLLTHHIPLAEAESAFDLARRNPSAMKVSVTVGGA